jgi:uncharacterized protein (TIGR00730 family)
MKNTEKNSLLNKKTDETKIKFKKNKKIINKPEFKIKRDFCSQQEMMDITTKRSKKVIDELNAGIKAIRQYPKSVTIFGSARLKPSDKYYKKAQSLAGKICESGCAVITGGGPGIMQAANQGTFEKCGSAIGFNIELPFEQNINPYVTHGIDFHYFFTRKVSMTFSGEVYIYFPGGFGTLDELFEILTLIQTRKIPRVPVILVGKDFWEPLVKYFEKDLLNKFETISKSDLNLYKIIDDEEEIVRIVKKAKLRDEYKK